MKWKRRFKKIEKLSQITNRNKMMESKKEKAIKIINGLTDILKNVSKNPGSENIDRFYKLIEEIRRERSSLCACPGMKRMEKFRYPSYSW